MLGLQTRQMNRGFPFPLATDNQLRTYDHIELFTTGIGDVGQYAAFPRLDDASQPLEEQARTYLDVNCAQCHRPEGGTTVALDLRFDTPLAATNTIGVAPQAGTLGLDDARIIAPGARGESVLWERM
ncbi:MAG: hypothetical protein JJU22_18385 [Gammaproteobacteria bacterium]|nr:hypothetical protein [Gammaproteobacteria bacterium]